MENEPIIKNLQEEALSKKTKNKKVIIIAVILLVIIGITSYFLPQKFNILSILNLSTGSTLAAVVNGEKITKDDLSYRIDKNREVFKQRGADLSDEKVLAKINKQMLDEMINEKILLQNAKKEGITASSDEISMAYDNLVSKFKNKDDFDRELASLSITEKGLKENINKQIVLSKYVEKNTEVKNITATKEETRDLYNRYKSNQKDIPKFEDIEKQLESEVKQQKTRVMVAVLIEKLKKEIEIKIFQ